MFLLIETKLHQFSKLVLIVISPFYYLYQNFGRKLAQTAIVSCERHAILTLRAFIELLADWDLALNYIQRNGWQMTALLQAKS